MSQPPKILTSQTLDDMRMFHSRAPIPGEDTRVTWCRQLLDHADAVDAREGALYDALHEIATLPEQGGCGDDIDAVELWMLMQKKARAALDAFYEAVPATARDESGSAQ